MLSQVRFLHSWADMRCVTHETSLAFRIPYRPSWYVIPYQGVLKLKCPVWVRAQQNGHGIILVAAATDHSLDPGLCACTWVSCAPLLARSSNLPLRRSRSGLWQPPPGRSYAHFSEPEQEPKPGISDSRILGM